jgi:hypothetical protein
MLFVRQSRRVNKMPLVFVRCCRRSFGWNAATDKNWEMPGLRHPHPRAHYHHDCSCRCLLFPSRCAMSVAAAGDAFGTKRLLDQPGHVVSGVWKPFCSGGFGGVDTVVVVASQVDQWQLGDLVARYLDRQHPSSREQGRCKGSYRHGPKQSLV